MKFYASPYVMPIGIIVFTILYPPSDQPRPAAGDDVIHTDFPIYADYTADSQEVSLTSLDNRRPVAQDTVALQQEPISGDLHLELSLRKFSIPEVAVLTDY